MVPRDSTFDENRRAVGMPNPLRDNNGCIYIYREEGEKKKGRDLRTTTAYPEGWEVKVVGQEKPNKNKTDLRGGDEDRLLADLGAVESLSGVDVEHEQVPHFGDHENDVVFRTHLFICCTTKKTPTN